MKPNRKRDQPSASSSDHVETDETKSNSIEISNPEETQAKVTTEDDCKVIETATKKQRTEGNENDTECKTVASVDVDETNVIEPVKKRQRIGENADDTVNKTTAPSADADVKENDKTATEEGDSSNSGTATDDTLGWSGGLFGNLQPHSLPGMHFAEGNPFAGISPDNTASKLSRSPSLLQNPFAKGQGTASFSSSTDDEKQNDNIDFSKYLSPRSSSADDWMDKAKSYKEQLDFTNESSNKLEENLIPNDQLSSRSPKFTGKAVASYSEGEVASKPWICRIFRMNDELSGWLSLGEGGELVTVRRPDNRNYLIYRSSDTKTIFIQLSIHKETKFDKRDRVITFSAMDVSDKKIRSICVQLKRVDTGKAQMLLDEFEQLRSNSLSLLQDGKDRSNEDGKDKSALTKKSNDNSSIS